MGSSSSIKTNCRELSLSDVEKLFVGRINAHLDILCPNEGTVCMDLKRGGR